MNHSFRRLPGLLLAPALLLLAPLPSAAAVSAAAARPAEPAVWPLSPRPEVVRGFELPAKPWLPGHRGVDLAGSPGQPVLSATAGKITYAGQLAGRGVIVVSRGPIRTTYEPVVPSVQPGTTVAPGTQIGHLSAAGSHCAPATCLHWGLLQSDLYLNPLSLLPTHPLRLLPTSGAGFDGLGTGFGASGPGSSGKAAPPALTAVPPTAGHRTSVAPQPSTPGPGKADRLATEDSANQLSDSQTGSPAAAIVVGMAALITIGGALMIRRH